MRYLLIDTPELKGNQPFSEEAKQRNQELLESGVVEIEFDIGEKFDRYNRLLAYIYVDGVSVQETLLEEGLARVAYVYPPNTKYLSEFEVAQEKAKNKGIGIWSIENYATESNGFDDSVVNQSKTNEKQSFKNCSELRKVHPNGVPKEHPAYNSKMDRDNDGWACER